MSDARSLSARRRKGLTPEDVEMAFKLLSKDGLKITKNDIKNFTDKYFRGKLKMVIHTAFMNRNKLNLSHHGKKKSIWIH